MRGEFWDRVVFEFLNDRHPLLQCLMNIPTNSIGLGNVAGKTLTKCLKINQSVRTINIVYITLI